jgi:hypothetical protein
MSDAHEKAKFWHDEKKCFVTYQELIGMANKLTDARARAADLLSNAYAVLRVVEHQLTDNEARLLLDIAQAIDTLEVMLDADEEEQ